MHILFVVPYVPNLIRVRPYNFIRHLANKGHKITVMTLWEDEKERDDIAQLSDDHVRVYGVHLSRWQAVWNCLRALLTAEPLQANYSWQPDFTRQLDGLLQDGISNRPVDIVHIEHLRGVKYGLHIKSRAGDIPVVWDSVDCISYLFRQASGQSRHLKNRWLTNFELSRTERYEGKLPGMFDRTLVTSKVDKDAYKSMSGPSNHSSGLSIVTNGVDLEYFHPNTQNDREEATLVISGKMSYHANVTMVSHFVEQIFPLIKEKNNRVKLWIVGKDPPVSVQAFSQDPAIIVTGMVADIRPFLQRATIAVSPVVYGAGIQNKVLEAMACETPVVSTTAGVSALDAIPGIDLLIANDPNEFAKEVLNLISNQNYQRQIGKAGRCYVEENHQWQEITNRLEGIYHEVINTKV